LKGKHKNGREEGKGLAEGEDSDRERQFAIQGRKLTENSGGGGSPGRLEGRLKQNEARCIHQAPGAERGGNREDNSKGERAGIKEIQQTVLPGRNGRNASETSVRGTRKTRAAKLNMMGPAKSLL